MKPEEKPIADHRLSDGSIVPDEDVQPADAEAHQEAHQQRASDVGEGPTIKHNSGHPEKS